jgi:hypothetical protein
MIIDYNYKCQLVGITYDTVDGAYTYYPPSKNNKGFIYIQDGEMDYDGFSLNPFIENITFIDPDGNDVDYSIDTSSQNFNFGSLVDYFAQFKPGSTIPTRFNDLRMFLGGDGGEEKFLNIRYKKITFKVSEEPYIQALLVGWIRPIRIITLY